MIKTGDSAKVVDRAKAVAQTRPGTVGVKVSVLSPHAKIEDRIIVNDEFMKRMREQKPVQEIKPKAKKSRKK